METSPPGALAASLSLGAPLLVSPGAFLCHIFDFIPVGSFMMEHRLYMEYTMTVF